MGDLVDPDGKPVATDPAPTKVFMNPVEALQKAYKILQNNPRDRAFRMERDVLESLLLGFIDYANQIKALKEQLNGKETKDVGGDPGSSGGVGGSDGTSTPGQSDAKPVSGADPGLDGGSGGESPGSLEP